MIQRHPIYWFEDADTILYQQSTQKNNEMLFRIHPSRFSSAKFLSHFSSSDDVFNTLLTDERDLHGCKYVILKRENAIDGSDLVALLDHIYGRNVLSAESDRSLVSAILRVTSPNHLDFPSLYKEAKKYFGDLFPKDAQGVAKFRCDHAEDALALAIQNDIRECQKPLLYYVATQTENDAFSAQVPSSVSSSITKRAHDLSAKLIEHFTPLLFTPPPTGHMACTDALAEHWMPLVISPAIDNYAMGQPLQRLEAIKTVDWKRYGLCETCLKDKIDEWTEEQTAVWDLVDGWIVD
ncbi:hypothetical protein BDP27DRAFT_1433802 [Rhodocollybia butyracea]|uniref:BTB domain-containing protein n=1 Tax=Rhodocollybia butyracea TaxID=206335 RepID=A0A9P5P8V1_9AGAR|nr:hypothetical protein BDP27DRAFT_1433802 [Rhodocollybia butyracea]